MLEEDNLMKNVLFILVFAVFMVNATTTLAQRVKNGQENPIPPRVVEKGSNCSDLMARGWIMTSGQFAYKATPSEYFINRDIHTISTEKPRWVLSGGAFPDLQNTIEIWGSRSTSYTPVNQVAWEQPSERRPVVAIIVEGENASNDNAYVYSGAGVFGDSAKDTYKGKKVVSVKFCLNAAPTAGEVSLSGKVVSAEGIPIAKARITILNTSSGETYSIPTNSLGFYKFEGLEVGNYVLTIEHKRFRFADLPKFLPLTDSLAEYNFTADP